MKSMTSDALPAIERKIAGELSRRPECFVVHPTEVRVLQTLTSEELQDFAIRNRWNVVRRLGGRQYQFYNDAFARMATEQEHATSSGIG